jgi:hypothetical protein
MEVAFSVFVILGFLVVFGLFAAALHLHLETKARNRDTVPEADEEPARQEEAPSPPPQPPQVGREYLIVINSSLSINGQPVPQGAIFTRDESGWRYGTLGLQNRSVGEALMAGALVRFPAQMLSGDFLESATRINQDLFTALNADWAAATRDFEATARDFEAMTRDFPRVMDRVVRARAAAAQPEAPKPAAKPTPKSAIDRLLENDSPISDKNPGVKTGS